MADETVTIRAELIDDITAGAAAVKAQMDALAASVTKLDANGAKFAGGGAAKVSKAMQDLNDMGQKAGRTLTDFADTIGSKLVTAAERGVEGLAALALAGAAVGVKFTMSMQQSQLALNTFFGSATAGTAVMTQLKSLLGPIGIGQLTQGVTSLETAGASPATVMNLMKSLANISAVSQNPGATFDTLSQAVNRIQETNMLEPRALMGFLQNGVDVYGLLSQELGIPRDRVKQMLMEMNRSGGSITAPANFLTDLSDLNGPMAKFANGLQQYRQTLPGIWSQIKVSAQEALSAMTTPLTDWLSREGPKLVKWEDDVSTRFKLLGGLLGSEWSSGNTKGFAATLGTILGDPQLASIIQPIASGIQSLATIFVHDFIPMTKDLLGVAVPALKALSGVLGFLSGQSGLVKVLVVAFAGFLGLVKVGSILVSIAEGLTALKTAGMIGGSESFLAGLFGAGVPGAGGAAAGAGAAGAAGKGGGFLSGVEGLGAGAAAVAAATAAAAAAAVVVGVHGLEHTGRAAVGEAAGGFGALGAAAKFFQQNTAHKSPAPKPPPAPTTIHIQSIQVGPGPTPQATGQAIGKGIQDQIDAYNKQVAERGGPLFQ